jgi:hypothetical protein
MLIESNKCQHRWHRWYHPDLRLYCAQCTLCGKEVRLDAAAVPPRPSSSYNVYGDFNKPPMEEGTSQQAPRMHPTRRLAERLRQPFAFTLLALFVGVALWQPSAPVYIGCNIGIIAALVAFECWRTKVRVP